MTLRYQPNPDIPWTFLDVKAKAGATGGSTATVRGCYFNPTISRTALFAILPLTATTESESNLRVGLRSSGTSFSTGAVINPIQGILHTAWVVGRVGGLLWGAQTSPDLSLYLPGPTPAPALAPAPLATEKKKYSNINGEWMNEAARACQKNMTWGVAYQPEGQSAYGRGVFTAAIEMIQQRQFSISFLHHIATQRNVVNPLEKNEVVGITNYLDLVFQLITDISSPSPSGGGGGSNVMRVGAAWQVNKNVQMKGRLGMDGVAVGVVVKGWWSPALTLGLCLSKPFSSNSNSNSSVVEQTSTRTRVGVTMTLESYRALRYERSPAGQKMMGGRVTQRHVASVEDIALHEGQGLLIPLSEVDNPEVLGQPSVLGGDYL